MERAEGQRLAQRRYNAAWRLKQRVAVLQHYGSKCTCCGETTPEFLTIDHRDGMGNNHRRSIGKTSGDGFYHWIIKNDFPDDLQLHCYNCNLSKYRYGSCPHKISEI